MQSSLTALKLVSKPYWSPQINFDEHTCSTNRLVIQAFCSIIVVLLSTSISCFAKTVIDIIIHPSISSRVKALPILNTAKTKNETQWSSYKSFLCLLQAKRKRTNQLRLSQSIRTTVITLTWTVRRLTSLLRIMLHGKYAAKGTMNREGFFIFNKILNYITTIPIIQLYWMKAILVFIYSLPTIFFMKPFVKTSKKPTTESPTTKRPPTKQPWTDRLTCFTCDAHNMDECMRTGSYKECEFNEQSCMIEARHRGGRTENVSHIFEIYIYRL